MQRRCRPAGIGSVFKIIVPLEQTTPPLASADSSATSRLSTAGSGGRYFSARNSSSLRITSRGSDVALAAADSAPLRVVVAIQRAAPLVRGTRFAHLPHPSGDRANHT